jgi:hypothetical protein
MCCGMRNDDLNVGVVIPLSPSGTPPKLGGELVTFAAVAECGGCNADNANMTNGHESCEYGDECGCVAECWNDELNVGVVIPLSPSGTPPKLGGELVTSAAVAECGGRNANNANHANMVNGHEWVQIYANMADECS